MRQNVLLGILVVLVVAVTSLNHYTTKVSTDYFTDAQSRVERDLFLTAATEDAQQTVQDVAVLGRVFHAERDQARKYASFLYEKLTEFYEIIQSQQSYIEDLEQKLLDNEIPLPGPTPDAAE